MAFMSKTLGSMKWVWGIYTLELWTIVHAVKIWRSYLMAQKFMIVTDKQALKYILEQKIATPD